MTALLNPPVTTTASPLLHHSPGHDQRRPAHHVEAGGLEGKPVLWPNLSQKPSDGAPPMQPCNSVAESCLSAQ
jgi:hypothetical protein